MPNIGSAGWDGIVGITWTEYVEEDCGAAGRGAGNAGPSSCGAKGCRYLAASRFRGGVFGCVCFERAWRVFLRGAALYM